MKRISLIIIAMLLSFVAFAQKLDTDFSQTRVMKVSGKTTTMEGHITFDGGDQLSMMYSNPKGDYFIVDGNQVKMNLLGKKAQMDAENNKQVKLQKSTLLNCLSGKFEQAAEDNNAELTINEEKNLRTVLIKAKGKVPKGGYSFIEMTFSLPGETLTKLVLEESTSGGILNTYELR